MVGGGPVDYGRVLVEGRGRDGKRRDTHCGDTMKDLSTFLFRSRGFRIHDTE